MLDYVVIMLGGALGTGAILGTRPGCCAKRIPACA
jgi:hypothetical protein